MSFKDSMFKGNGSFGPIMNIYRQFVFIFKDMDFTYLVPLDNNIPLCFIEPNRLVLYEENIYFYK